MMNLLKRRHVNKLLNTIAIVIMLVIFIIVKKTKKSKN